MRTLFAFFVVGIFVGCASHNHNHEHNHEHKNHEHMHGENCGHKAVKHDDHWDYVHNGHYHHQVGNKVVDHGVYKAGRWTASEDKQAHCEHKKHAHEHKEGCGHKTVKHDNHEDYVHDGHYHHKHGKHTDDHGNVVKKK